MAQWLSLCIIVHNTASLGANCEEPILSATKVQPKKLLVFARSALDYMWFDKCLPTYVKYQVVSVLFLPFLKVNPPSALTTVSVCVSECACSLLCMCAMLACVVRGLMCIHPSFRIVALAEPPVVGSTTQQWLNAEQLTVFLYHNMRTLSVDEELHILNKSVTKYTFCSC